MMPVSPQEHPQPSFWYQLNSFKVFLYLARLWRFCSGKLCPQTDNLIPVLKIASVIIPVTADISRTTWLPHWHTHTQTLRVKTIPAPLLQPVIKEKSQNILTEWSAPAMLLLGAPFYQMLIKPLQDQTVNFSHKISQNTEEGCHNICWTKSCCPEDQLYLCNSVDTLL